MTSRQNIIKTFQDKKILFLENGPCLEDESQVIWDILKDSNIEVFMLDVCKF